MPKFNPERAATALIDAVYQGDKAAALKWGVSERSIREWRSRLDEDPIFAAFFHKKKENYESGWSKVLPGAILKAVNFLEKAAEQADPKDPDAIHAVAGAFKLLADTAIAKQVIDARSASSSSQVG